MILNLRTLIFSFLFVSGTIAQTVPSPDEFLGYPLGTRFTLHYKIVQYVEALAKSRPDMMKVEYYGKTYEGRQLLVTYISSPENISSLESIRQNNLRLAMQSKDKMAANENTPAIVWMSYNVHGNEASSSEAVMKTLYALLDPANSATKQWLKNTVVIIDPCINPDGRDRYANWYHQVASAIPDPRPSAREHAEPWPGGRTNHYNFDLNRDWAWQSQVETQQRLKLYNRWLPQIHVDFHEQGYNEPYYFAPAAEPYHEVITPWQREFQVKIGRNHAKYFDANGWLYFTKERFDLLYPSYGDTYPTYNGAIGMTYEQGGIRAGLAIINEDGDTLTLKDRLEHHYTTGLSTIEVASANAAKLVKEYRKYFTDAVTNGSGEFKTYIIRPDPAKPDVQEGLKKFLDNNGILYEYASPKKPAKVYNYISGKEESITTEVNDMLISSYQPRSALAKVLFEPRSRITDTATYDITAWSIPYAWGLQAYASRERISGGGSEAPVVIAENKVEGKKPIGYVVPWNSFAGAKLLSNLLQRDVKVRYAEQPFAVDGKNFDKGALIVLRTSNMKFGDTLENVVMKSIGETGFKTSIAKVYTGFVDKGHDFGSPKVRSISKPRVAMLTGDGVSGNAAGQIWHYFEQELRYPLSLINQDGVGRIKWSDFDVVIMPDGFYRFIQDKPGQEALKNWITQGGKLIALENAAEQISTLDWGLKMKKSEEGKDEDKQLYDRLKRFENAERDYLPSTIPGAVYKVELDNSHPLAFGYGDHFFVLKRDDTIYEYLKSGWNVGAIRKENYVSGFAGSKTKEKMKDGLMFGAMNMGSGNIVIMATDPIFRSFWESGKLLFANAVFMVD
ncbi:MAG TPA: M14 metallopeptidase family protein [Chitinophagaceae bacterium]|nr:M14 metallopeptidase family protein [Chitinophagaceae bacterium]